MVRYRRGVLSTLGFIRLEPEPGVFTWMPTWPSLLMLGFVWRDPIWMRRTFTVSTG